MFTSRDCPERRWLRFGWLKEGGTGELEEATNSSAAAAAAGIRRVECHRLQRLFTEDT